MPCYVNVVLEVLLISTHHSVQCRFTRTVLFPEIPAENSLVSLDIKDMECYGSVREVLYHLNSLKTDVTVTVDAEDEAEWNGVVSWFRGKADDWQELAS